jgi:hypothetical protein
MYSKDGERYFIVDSQVHFWDGSPANQSNHRNLSPSEWVWTLEKFGKYSEETMIHDLFETGYVGKAIFQPNYLSDFYVDSGEAIGSAPKVFA